MVRAYPNQQVYFSYLTAPAAERLFERDYWSGSMHYGLEWLLRYDASPSITVGKPISGLLHNSRTLLSPAQQRRIRIVPNWQQARYFCTIYRWHPQSNAAGTRMAYRPGGRVKTLSIFRLDSLGSLLLLAAAAFHQRN